MFNHISEILKKRKFFGAFLLFYLSCSIYIYIYILYVYDMSISNIFTVDREIC